ncbi:hypothetical protein AAES_121211 [Amazona aestiva]|uniref:Uncharacterized protein n=1 Tax=Amazona aestiva TaxID=12930 RepID=A0A0Q3TBW2_AMAAE|nr:hypothetical protein AAES_121211 [Amazona aestiva]
MDKVLRTPELPGRSKAKTETLGKAEETKAEDYIQLLGLFSVNFHAVCIVEELKEDRSYQPGMMIELQNRFILVISLFNQKYNEIQKQGPKTSPSTQKRVKRALPSDHIIIVQELGSTASKTTSEKILPLPGQALRLSSTPKNRAEKLAQLWGVPQGLLEDYLVDFAVVSLNYSNTRIIQWWQQVVTDISKWLEILQDSSDIVSA